MASMGHYYGIYSEEKEKESLSTLFCRENQIYTLSKLSA
ncbi:hypothetical protein CHCC14820_0516 [Bacillus paralicheniformis]|nr:hypothetical protein CHCC14820_0516 [Bacillus paralicheniformis]